VSHPSTSGEKSVSVGVRVDETKWGRVLKMLYISMTDEEGEGSAIPTASLPFFMASF